MSFRLQQINKNLHHELSKILIEIANPKWGMVTITEVLVTPDLNIAKIWLSAPIEAINELNRSQKVIFHALRPRLKFKHIPKLTFYIEDGSINRVDQLLEEIHES